MAAELTLRLRPDADLVGQLIDHVIRRRLGRTRMAQPTVTTTCA